MKNSVLWRLRVAMVVIVAAMLVPASIQAQSISVQQVSSEVTVAVGQYCEKAPTAFTCGQETCITACMTPEEWKLCGTHTWFADSYDHRFAAPEGANSGNRIRFFERCGTVCRPMGSPRMAYRTHGGTLGGVKIEPRWVVFPFSPARER